MKKVLIVGASGKVGKIVAEKMSADSDFTPIALFRKEEQKAYFDKLGIASQVLSLEADIELLNEAMKGIDAVVFTAGSGGNTGYDKTLAIDLDGAVKAIEAAQQAGAGRFIMVSALMADDRTFWDQSGIKPYYIAKHYADRILKSSSLNYTILRPGRLLDEPGTGNITVNNPASQKGVSREDVAHTVIEALKQENSIGKVLEFNAGDLPIKEVIKNL